MNKFSKDAILSDLRALGIQNGDVVFVTANIMNVGMVGDDKRSISKNWIGIFKDLVGENGGVVAVSYTQTFNRFKKNQECVFDRNSKSTSGSLSNIFIKDPAFIRSSHPSNSYIGYGSAVYDILNQHTHLGKSYDVPLKLISLNCKHLMLGTVDDANAPLSLHVAQQLIGDTLNRPTNYLLQTYYYDGGVKTLFTKSDAGGCSSGGYKLFNRLKEDGLITDGYVGDAYSAVIPGPKSLAFTLDILNKNPEAFRCSNEKCKSCNPRFWNLLPSKILRFF